MKRIYLYLIVALCCMTACEKPIEFDLDETEPMIVVSSVVEPDSNMRTRVTLSRFFLDNSNFKVVNDATLQLTVNGVPTGTSEYSKGYYTTNVVPQSGDSLHLVVTVPNHGMVSAGTRVPMEPNVSAFKVNLMPGSDYWNKEMKLSFIINDELSEHVGYMVTAYVVDSMEVTDTTYQPRWDEYYNYIIGYDTIPPHVEVNRYPVWMESDDPLLSQGIDMSDIFDILKVGGRKGESTKQYLFLDDDFSGRSHEFLIKGIYYNYDYDGSSSDIVHHEHIELQVAALNYDLYMYTKTRKQAYEADELFSEPVQIYCNIKDGIGIFGAMSRVSKTSILE